MKADSEHSSILHGFRTGEESAIRALFHRYYRPLCYFAESILQHKEEAEDLVVDNFLKLLQKKDDFNELTEIKSFLYTAVRNACIDVLRKNKRLQQAGLEIAYLGSPDEPLFGDELLRAKVLQMIYDEVEKLPAKCREVFVELCIKGKTTAEVARLCQISPQTVLNQKSKAIRLLRLALDEKGVDMLMLLVASAGTLAATC